MATKKISELEAINAAEDNDVLVIVDTSESTTNKITKGNLLIGAGHTIEMTLNENYQIVLVLKNAAGTALSTQTIDLPNENAITNLAYNNGVLTVTKQSGATSQINLTGLIEGLVTESDFNTFKEALQTTLEAINEKDTEQDEAIAENYKVINKLNEKLENQQKVINQLPQVTGQGTEVTLQDTIAAPFTIFDVEGNSEQETTEGKNKVDVTSGTINIPSTLTLTQNADGTLTLNGNTGGTLYYSIQNMKFANIVNGNLYKLVTKVKSGTWNAGVIGMQFRDSNAQQIQSLQNSSSSQERKVINGDVNEVRLYLSGTFSATNLVIEIMLVEASVTDDSFEKFTYGASPNPNYEQPIKSAGDNGSINEKISNKNYLPNNVVNQTKNGVTLVKNNDGTITANGTATAQTEILISSVKLSAGNYLGSIGVTGSISTYYVRLGEGTTSQSPFIANIGTGDNAFTLDETKIIGAVLIIRSGQTLNNVIFKPMIRLASITDNSYVPHEEQDYSIFVQQPFRSNKDKTIKDKFVIKSDNKKYERHYIGEVVLNGTEEIYLYNDNGNRAVFYINVSDLYDYTNSAETPELLSNRFRPVSQTATWEPGGIACRIGGRAIFFIFETGTTINDFKNWLSTHNVVVQYELAEPLDLPCTPEQVEQLENLPSTYKDFTIIQSEDETEAYLEVSGIRDIDTMFDKVTNAIVSLGGNV